MAKKKILFVSFDEEYITTIEYKFSSLINEQATIEFISDEKFLSGCEDKLFRMDIVILPVSLRHKYSDLEGKAAVYYLTDIKDEGSNPQYIYKYDSIKFIAEKIDTRLINSTTDKKKGTKVIGAFSPAGGTGKTLLSMLLAYKLQNKGNRVLYVSTVSHQDFSYYIEGREYLSTEFCYQCTINIRNALKIINKEIRKGDFDYLPPFKNLPVSYKINFGIYMQIVEYIKKQNIYDYIVVELSPELQQDKLVFLKQCDIKLLISTQDRISVRRLETFISGIPDTGDNPILVCNRYDRRKTDYLSISPVIESCELSQYIDEMYDELDWSTAKSVIDMEKTYLCII